MPAPAHPSGVTVPAWEFGAGALEHDHQVALFDWAREHTHLLPELGLLYAIPNGGHRSKRTAARMQREGLKSGLPDVCLPVPRGRFGALYVEMKTESGYVRPDQREWHNALLRAGNHVAVCRSFGEAAGVILEYLSL